MIKSGMWSVSSRAGTSTPLQQGKIKFNTDALQQSWPRMTPTLPYLWTSAYNAMNQLVHETVWAGMAMYQYLRRYP